ncbi:MAG: WXG100 family type VII secretion target [Defluviitaleaceae bacterium]|nr:WXG100 family type VII secretion target [Defluviitaleaceae bacterium]MCL2262414.1 WXG100 family type VII secretion target [Defluviitaleaceae bacterium]
MHNDILEFDLNKLHTARNKCNEIAQTLTSEKNTLLTQLQALRQEWNTPAGRRFFNDQNTDWAAQVEQYVQITNALSDLLGVAAQRYGVVFEDAQRLNI